MIGVLSDISFLHNAPCRGGNARTPTHFKTKLHHCFQSDFRHQLLLSGEQSLVNELHSSSPFSLQQLDNCDANQLNDPVIVLNFHYPVLDTVNLLQYVVFLEGEKNHSIFWQSVPKLPWLFVMSTVHLCSPPLLCLFSPPHSVCIVLPLCLDFR